MENNTQQRFIEDISKQINIISDGKDRFRILTPFMFDDGDHISVVLKKNRKTWVLSDEGHTYMHFASEIAKETPFDETYEKIISHIISTYNIIEHNGELIFEVENERFGQALYSFAQTLIRIGDILYFKNVFREVSNDKNTYKMVYRK